MISPYALLTASRPKSAASIVTPYDLYSVVQNREDMPSPPPDSPASPAPVRIQARAPITSATSVSVITTPSAARHSARLPLCDLPYAFSIYRAGHTGRRRPSALRRFRLLSLFFRFLFRKIQILRGLLFFRTAGSRFSVFKRLSRRRSRIEHHFPIRRHVCPNQPPAVIRPFRFITVKTAFKVSFSIFINRCQTGFFHAFRQTNTQLSASGHDIAARRSFFVFKDKAFVHREHLPSNYAFLPLALPSIWRYNEKTNSFHND